MEVRRTTPSAPDWPWLVTLPMRELSRRGTCEREEQWIKQAYAWCHSRLEPSEQCSLPVPEEPPKGPPEGLFPVLLFHRGTGEGLLGFVVVTLSSQRHRPSGGACPEPMQEAADAVASWYSGLILEPTWATVELRVEGRDQVDGSSASLPTMMQALAQVLGIQRWPEDVCATGCWENGTLKPVDESTLSGKTAIARQWGYRRLVVVERQKGLPNDGRMTIIEAPRDPGVATLVLVERLLGDAGAEAVARALAIFDKSAVRTPNRDLKTILERTEPFTRSGQPLVLHIVHDIRCRALMHEGQTDDALGERCLANKHTPYQLPDGWLGDFFTWHLPASRAILALDLGIWEDDAREHKEVDEAICAVDRDPRKGAKLAALVLRNTRGRRYEFLGRIREDRTLLNKSWHERVHYATSWDFLFEYAQETLELRGDYTLHRQHNQCMDVLASYWELSGGLPPDDCSKLQFWPDKEAISNQDNAWDLAAWLRWKAITKQPVSEQDVCVALKQAKSLVNAKPHKNTYPVTLIFEAILRHNLGTEDQRRCAAELLARSSLFTPGETKYGDILALLAIRAGYLLDQCGFPHGPLVQPRSESTIAHLARDLLAKPGKILARCPY